MAVEVEKEVKKSNEVFDSKAVSSLVNTLRQSFASGKTRSYEWRVSLLKSVAKLVNDRKFVANELVFSLEFAVMLNMSVVDIYMFD
ncbi:hypothetical protein PanWU01x14_340860 [Parasponia andersonii]|uniref:Uncharacterized protein n=1 Tax=Parasponia andersonii TaxID=3476 RepID=A0A2P5AE87_PARAD|nr:hypothetical protein PanWU01x14_340860 [Parasponia andersonii]